MTSGAARRAAALRALHVPGRPLILVNAWDAESARVVAAAGFEAVATSSGAVAASLGHADGGTAPPDEMFAALSRVARAVPVPVTADVEDGYGLGPDELVARLLSAGAVGCNLEDSDHAHPGTLVPLEDQVARLAAVRRSARAAGVDLVLNARVDVHLRQVGPAEGRVAAALARMDAYLAAGAHCVYPIMLDGDDRTLAALVEGCSGPVNLLARPDPADVARLAGLGAARVSTGSGPFRTVTAGLADLAASLAAAMVPGRAS